MGTEFKNVASVVAKNNENYIFTKLAALDGSRINFCTEVQKNVVLKYGAQMLENHYKEPYVLEVCNAMATLYTTKVNNKAIEDLLPKEVPLLPGTNKFDDDRLLDPDHVKQRKDIKEHLSSVMKANGGDYQIIEECLVEQRMGSWNDKPSYMKSFLLDQLTDGNNNNKYYWGITDSVEHTREQLGTDYPDQEQYKKTVAMYQAFTGIILNHVDNIPGADKENGELTAYRGVNYYIPGGPQGVSESTSLSGFVEGYGDGGSNQVRSEESVLRSAGFILFFA